MIVDLLGVLNSDLIFFLITVENIIVILIIIIHYSESCGYLFKLLHSIQRNGEPGVAGSIPGFSQSVG